MAMGSERRTREPTDECLCEETNGEDSIAAITGQFDNDNNGFKVESDGELRERS